MQLHEIPEDARHELEIAAGTIWADHGQLELVVQRFLRTIKAVYATIHGSGGTGCGQTPKDTVCWYICAEGIVIACDVQSDRAVIEWVATGSR